ncbi:hypothetical protein K450DRAFT_268972 [Umbelopsis ramanniana AG]|uniref:Uncharacterized protein n=1 Tax=Umbelopsis ramanniana AG TaxID=1314678 RepID=A0AAD5EHX1_UMBRA|nr:uncharacterized protein K450DRAFT_268972 [Umbelopsis ramanniana AG]KAI8582610.1 hypothetical protein K450DRAFT_268972 [Umbelopsis ramanniana AG]
MEHNINGVYDTRALPTNAFMKGFIERTNVQERLQQYRCDKAAICRELYFKDTFVKMLLAISKLHVSIVKCRQILKTMIVDNPDISNVHGLALCHMMLEQGKHFPGKKTWRSFGFRDRFTMCLASPMCWTGKLCMHDGRRLEMILVGHAINILNHPRYPVKVRYRPPKGHNDDERWDETCGMPKADWAVAKYAKILLHGLRKLMKSVLVEEDTAFENVLELFRFNCAEAIAQHTPSSALAWIRLYASCILECTLSSGSYYLLDLADKCKNCKDCELISRSHQALLGKVEYEDLLSTSPLTSRDDILKLSSECNTDLENFKATLIQPKSTPFLSHLGVADQELKCGDIRDILKAATLLASYRFLADGRSPPNVFVGATFYDPHSMYSKFHPGTRRYATSTYKFKRNIKSAILLAGDKDLINLRVDESIFIFAVDRQDVDGKNQELKASQELQASDIVMDGKEMAELLKCIQVEGGSATYSKNNFGAFQSAKFTGAQKLCIPPSAEDLLQAGVYTSISRENDDEIGYEVSSWENTSYSGAGGSFFRLLKVLTSGMGGSSYLRCAVNRQYQRLQHNESTLRAVLFNSSFQ